MEVGRDGELIVIARDHVDGERNTGIGNAQTLAPEMEDETAVESLNNMQLAN